MFSRVSKWPCLTYFKSYFVWRPFGRKKAAWGESPWLAPKKSAITRRNLGVSRGSLGKLSVAAMMTNQTDSNEKHFKVIEFLAELQAETEAWERASDEAWRMIDRMEKDEGFESW